MDTENINGCVPTNEYCKVKNFMELYNRMLELFKCEQVESDTAQLAERIFLYCLCWGVCGTLNPEDRKKMSNNYFCKAGNNFPVPKLKDNSTIFD